MAEVSSFFTGVSGYARSGISTGSKSPASSVVLVSSVTFSVAGAACSATSSFTGLTTSLVFLTASAFSLSTSITSLA